MALNRYGGQEFGMYTTPEFIYETDDADQQAFLIGNSTVNKKNYAQTFVVPEGPGLPASAQAFDDYKQQEPAVLDINSLVLPPPNFSCYVEPPVGRGTVQYFKHVEPTITRTVTLNFNTTKTVVRENIVHHQHVQTVITNVNRNHWHTQRVVVKDNNYHHYLINNVVKIADIHHQKIEHVRGESKSFKDFKQTQKIEAALCDFSDKDPKIVNTEFDAATSGTSSAPNPRQDNSSYSYASAPAAAASGNNNNNNAR